ncbi:30S ribosomal protein S17 [Candidatus Pacearchaeota archaeon]|nr:30S ribosomal protein S17 [Candidatus Pacearchaeota archaeon]
MKEAKVEKKVGWSKTPTSSVEDVKRKEAKVVETMCRDKDCHVHGNLKVRGRTFEGKVIKKFHKRIAIEFERMIYVRKYERYKKSRTKIHARLPVCMEKEINVGDLIKVQECRPLSKIIHFVVIEKIKSGGEGK